MANSTRIVLLAKLESTPGVAATPTAGDDAMLISEPSISVEAENVERNLTKTHFGANASLTANALCKCEFSVELAGSGAKNTAPAFGGLLQACAMSEKKSSTKVDYKPVSDNHKTVSLYYYLDGRLHTITGAMGSWSLSYENNAIPMLKFSFQGTYNNASTTALPTANFAKFKPPLLAGAGNLTSFILLGISKAQACPISMEIDYAAGVKQINTLCASKQAITERASTAKVVIEAPVLSTKDYFKEAVESKTGAFSFQHGNVEGQIVSFSAPKIQQEIPSYGDNEQILTLETSLRLLPTSGNDDFTLTFK